MRVSKHESNRVFKDLDDFKPGDSIDLEFTEFDIDGVRVMPRTWLRGVLLHPALAIVRVEQASPELEIDLPEIGLGVRKELTPPLLEHPLPSLPYKIAEGGTFSYFDPEDIDHATSYPIVPRDRYRHRLARYGHAAVDGTLIF